MRGWGVEAIAGYCFGGVEAELGAVVAGLRAGAEPAAAGFVALFPEGFELEAFAGAGTPDCAL